MNTQNGEGMEIPMGDYGKTKKSVKTKYLLTTMVVFLFICIGCV
jgi:hypothetical protein